MKNLKPLYWSNINGNVYSEDIFNIFGISIYIRYDICKDLNNNGVWICCQFPNDSSVFKKAHSIREGKDLCEEYRNKFFSGSIESIDSLYQNKEEDYTIASLDEAIAKFSSSKKDKSVLKYLRALKRARSGRKIKFSIKDLEEKINEYRGRRDDSRYSKLERDNFRSIIEWLSELKLYYIKDDKEDA